MALRALRHAVLALACCGLACASTRVEPIKGTGFAPEEDERALWGKARKLDDELAKSRHLLPDVELEAYLDDVVARLLAVSGTSAPPPRVRVMLDPYANAFALPNGSIYLHTGLLSPMENEAQLATVLGHELTHYLERHALREERTRKNREAARNVGVGFLAVLMAAGGQPYAAADLMSGSSGLGDELIATMVAGYSRDLEREADARSIEMLRGAGYQAEQAIAAFELLRADSDATEAKIPYAYSSHPRIQERIDSLRELLDEGPRAAGQGETNESAFQQKVASVLLANAELELETGAVVPAQKELERYVALRPEDPRGQLTLADAYRRSGPEREHVTRAAQTLERAASQFPQDAAIQLELGLLYRELDDRERAKARLLRYLELAPEAADRRIIERYVAELQ